MNRPREQGFYALQASAEVRAVYPLFMPEYNKTSGIRSNRCGFRLFRVLSFVSRASGFARVHAASFQIRNAVHNSLSNQGVG